MTSAPQMPHRWTARVCYADTDAGGVVHHMAYLRWFEAARTDWLAGLGIEQRKLKQESGTVFVIREARLSYRRPAELDDFVCVSTGVAKVGRTSLEIAQTAGLASAQSTSQDSASSNQELVNASFVLVAVDTVRRQVTALPASLREALQAR